MGINEFLKDKKWHIISGGVFLVIFAIITGVFSQGMNGRFNSLKDQIDRISSGVSSLETSSAAFSDSSAELKESSAELRDSVDEISGKSSKDTSGQPTNPELQSKLDRILSQLSDLKKTVGSLKVSGQAEKQPAKLTEKTIAVPDTSVPKSPANPTKSDKQPQSSKIFKTGQDLTITIKAKEVSNMYGYQFNLKYDHKKAIYKGSLKSSISGINTIFKKDMTDYLLVGATMVGDTPGYSDRNVTVCTMMFTVTADIDPSSFTVNGVSAVDANQSYAENIDGWSVDVKAN